MATGSEIFTNALYEIGVYAAAETPSAEDLEFVRTKFNRLIGRWNTQKRYVFYTGHAQYTFGASQQVYTIGPSGADFTAPRPLKIVQANLVLTAVTPYVFIPLQILDQAQYANLGVPGLTSTIPICLYYEPTNPNGSLYPWPYPTTTTNQLDLWTWNRLNSIAFADVTVEYDLPDGYEDALTLSLAETLCAPFGVDPPATLAMQASKARQAIQSLNTVPPLIRTRDAGIPRSPADRPGWNYRTGNPNPS